MKSTMDLNDKVVCKQVRKSRSKSNIGVWGALAGVWLACGAARSEAQMPERYGLGNGSAGAYVAPGGNTVINRYAALSATVAAGGTEIALSSAVGFQASDLILVWQVQAGEYSSGTNNDVELGANAATGYYELARIQSISGSILALDHPLAHAYNAPGAQVVRVPEYTTVSVPAAAQITATPWDGSKGGIVAFLASGAVTLQGRVRVSGQGFRGGAFSLPWCNGSCAGAPADAQSAADDATCRMGRRGESFDLSAAGFGTNACGTGNRATGGGGGGHINAGGGGGGNGAAGSVGGNAWLSNADTGGSAGVAVSGSLMNALTFGGGGGDLGTRRSRRQRRQSRQRRRRRWRTGSPRRGRCERLSGCRHGRAEGQRPRLPLGCQRSGWRCHGERR